MIAKINIWIPLLSKAVVKSMAQWRQNESKTDLHEGDANFVLGGTKPFSLRIFRTVFFETYMPIKLSSSEIRCAPQMALYRFMSIMRSTVFSWIGGLPFGFFEHQIILSLRINRL